MAIQQLTQPILNSVSAFDASNSYEFKFSAIGGAQVVGNKLVISNNKTGVEVYNETQNNLRLFHLLPVKTLSNGEYYNAVIYTVDNAGNLSEPSVPVPFYCYTNPMLSITNIPSGGTIENGTYEFTGSYIQNEGELLDSYEFVLYDSNKNELTNTGVIYYASNNSLSYTFQGMSNDTSYYIELKGYTVNNTNITTGLLSFNVRYILPASFAICDLINDCENGYIQISSNLVAIDGKSNPSPPIYIDDKEVDLTGDDAWVNWDTGFNIKNDFTTRIWGRDFNPYETIVEMVNSEDTTSAPNRIEMKWMLGTVMKKLPYYNRVSGLTLNLNDSLEYPIKNMKISGNDIQLVEDSEDIFTNLLKEYSLLNSVIGNGVTVKSKQDGSFLIDGTTTSLTHVEFVYNFQIGSSVQSVAKVNLDSNETYTLSLSLLQGTLPTGISLNVQTQSGVFTFETVTNVGSISFSGATGIYRGWINIPSGITLENVIIAPQLEKGDTATGYIQNGIASQFKSNRPKNINLDLKGNSSQYEVIGDPGINVTGESINVQNVDINRESTLYLEGNSIQNSEYQQVEYLEGSGNQYIDTGYKHSQNTEYEVEFMYNYLQGQSNGFVLGSRISSLNQNLSFTVDPNGFFIGTGSSYNSFGVSSKVNIKYKAKRTKTNVVYNNITYDCVNNMNIVSTYNVSLFACNENGTNIRFLKGRIYSCKFSENNILIRNFIPCYRKSDNIAGMYDTVNNTFYTNAGTGNFTVGADVTIPNPDFPVPVQSCGDNGTINEVVCNKNLFDKDKAKQNYILSATGQEISSEGSFVSDFILLKANTTYYNNARGYSNAGFYNLNKNFIKIDFFGANCTVTFQEDCYVKLNGKIENINTYQLEVNSRATEYIEHQEQLITIPTQQPFRSIGDVRDRFVKVDGVWKEEHNIKEIIINIIGGTITLSNGNIGGVINTVNKRNEQNHEIMCTIAKVEYSKEENTIYENPYNCVIVGNSMDTLETMKSKFDGGKLYYQLATPTYLDCTPEQISILNSMQNVKYPTTNIYSTDTVSPMANFTYNIVWDVPSPEHPSRIKSCGEYIYGIKRDISTTSPLWERVEDNVNMTANAQIGIAPVQNDFDSVYPYSDIKTVNYDVASKTVTAEIGDSNFKFDGTNGEVLTIIPEMWVKREYKIENGITYEYRWVSNFSQPGYIYVPEFYYGRYDMYVDSNNVGHSFSGYVPAYNRNISNFRNCAKALSTDFCLEDWHRFIIETLYLVEYANNNSQAVLGNGIVSMRISNDDKALLAETNTNRIIINTTGENAFVVGQTICIGTTTTYSSAVAANRTITAIEDYSSGGVTGKAITFNGATVNIALNNVIWSSAQISGGCDTLGMKSGCLVNDNKHSVIYRGIENIFGNVLKFIDGINIKDNQAYICYTPASYASDVFTSPYTQLGYVNSKTNNWVKTLGYDSNNSLIGLTTEVGGTGSTTGYCNYYYQNQGNRIALAGGDLGFGVLAGLFFWHLSYASDNIQWTIGARILKYQ